MCPEKQTHDVIIYVDIKSPSLRDILRCILKDIRTAGLEADKPAVRLLMLYADAGFLANSSIGGAKLIVPFPSRVEKLRHRLRRRYHGRGWHATPESANQAPRRSIRDNNQPNELASGSQEDNIRLVMGVLQTGRTAIHDLPFHRSAPLRSLQLRQRDEDSPEGYLF
jgi:hypothetical protein